ncbi:acetyl-CoA carboxylase biotin carboxyl carrier protein [Hathewaya histolytica]|uniref:acetyl-CoA carboxylase biotin carboxyl carrier protein n=1 Tax=Hathewaya histolytica TaxID=1498 RepID=UPI003B683121
MDIKNLEEIAKILKKYDLDKICLETDGFKLDISNSNQSCKSQADDNDKYSSPVKVVEDENIYVLKSPLVGVFHISKNIYTKSSYSVGDNVKEGQPLCTIEAMKMFNEVLCKNNGILIEILVCDGDFVEYDQELFKIKRQGKENV